jgi:hypothetical protein
MSAHSTEELETIQVVVDRVSSYQDGAPEGTVRDELLAGLDSAGIRLEDAEVTRLADAIEEQHGGVEAATELGG